LRFHPDKCKVLSITGKLQTLLAYSRIGLTSDLNNKQNVLKSKYLNDLLIMPTI
jgi:hypothetical protein